MSTSTQARPTPLPTADPTTDHTLATDIGLLGLRIGFGVLFVVHGAQKLFGWFDGPGWQTTADGFDMMGYNPGAVFGTLAGLTELAGGLALILGLLTPLTAAVVLGTMVNAINTTWSAGLMGSAGSPGYEMALVYAIAFTAIAFTGPGRFSLDHGRPWARQGVQWGIAAVALAVGTGGLTLLLKWML